MSGNGIFTLGLLGPLALLYVGQVVIGLLFSGMVIIERLRADTEQLSGQSQSKVDSSIAVLVISELLSICGGIVFHNGEYGTGMNLALIGIFLLWPVSAVLAILGKGAGRRVLLVGHALIALWIIFIFLAILIFVLWSRLNMR
jgi:hypothetical protein